FFALTATATVLRADVIVVPNANTTVQGTTPFPVTSGAQHVMGLFDASQFAGLGGPILITGFAQRPNSAQQGPGSITQTARVFLSTTSRTPTTLSANFADNVGSNNTLVFNGTSTATLDNVPGPGNTRQFANAMTFQTPFLYDPRAGNLLFDSQISDLTATNA